MPSLTREELERALHTTRSIASTIFAHPQDYPRAEKDAALVFHYLHVIAEKLNAREYDQAEIALYLATGLLVDGKIVTIAKSCPWIKVPELVAHSQD